MSNSSDESTPIKKFKGAASRNFESEKSNIPTSTGLKQPTLNAVFAKQKSFEVRSTTLRIETNNWLWF